MQQLSFDPADPWLDLLGWRVAVQVVTFENLYGLDPARVSTNGGGDRVSISCDGLTWAGGQERCDGWARIDAQQIEGGVEAVVSAGHSRTVRSLKLLISGLPAGDVLGDYWRPWPVGAGLVLNYPFPLHTPLVFLAAPDGTYLYFQSLDARVRAKRFAFFERDGAVTGELIFDPAAHEPSTSAQTPPWRIGRCADPAEVVARHLEHVARAYGLEQWETRADVPGWAREIALVVALHGMHWTGRVFNTYDRMLEALRWTAERIEGRRVLAFLPGWEGRYYWQYGDSRPEPRLGGEEGFRRLAEGAARLGVKLMPMFGVNCANSGLENFEQWGAPSRLRSAGGLVFQGNRPDWDASRARDPGWQAWLNPGAPPWRGRLLEQVSRLVELYDLPAVFFDTQHVWLNDPAHPVYEGIALLCGALRSRFPDLLIAGEGWYDALGALTPVSQVGAPERWPEIFGRFCRTFTHLSAGDPSRGSTGVHELGQRAFALAPDAPHWWPTLTVVDGTLERAPERAEEVIAQARRYAERYLP
ncbi:MAG: hypothetical protein A2148_11490 [Chloroflexi bacterium RBG_16_68_14]|nr:MAG: hypothetical protein A2148_11490 [Chloroflexi bacterium RBG_16_68_14]